MIKPLKKERFELFMLGARNSGQNIYEEKSFWSNQKETIIGFIAQDRIDNDYAYMILMRDKINRFRPVRGQAGIPKQKDARKLLRDKFKELKRSSTEDIFIQEDEPDKFIDLLNPPEDTDKNDLHTYFKQLTQNPAYAPAKKVVDELSPWIRPKDQHLESEFQKAQFDQRLWEIYLWASLKELRFDVRQLEAPDFLCGSHGQPLFTIEATTVTPSTSGVLSDVPEEPDDMESLQEYLDGYMSIKFGSSLFSKLKKKYWEKDQAKGLPLIIAVADFHRIGTEDTPSMTYTRSALAPYLYGFKSLVIEDDSGNYKTEYTPIEKHTYLSKEIPSGYFNLPDAENISAVLFCNAGTIAKFNRMGVCAGYGLPNYQYIRSGEMYDMSDPVATDGIPRRVNIESDNYHENWSDELELYHNPNAKYPLPPDYFQNINQHFSEGNRIRTRGYSTWIYSMTSMIEIRDE